MASAIPFSILGAHADTTNLSWFAFLLYSEKSQNPLGAAFWTNTNQLVQERKLIVCHWYDDGRTQTLESGRNDTPVRCRLCGTEQSY